MSLKPMTIATLCGAALLAILAGAQAFKPAAGTVDGTPDGLVFADQTAFRAEVRSYLLDNPDVIMEAIEILEVRQQEAQAMSDAERVAAILPSLHADAGSWQGGNPDGDIILVEFVDYRCSYCRRAHDEVQELVASDGNIRLIVKEFPILGEASLVSSQFAIAVLQVAGPEAYKSVNAQLIALRGNPDAPTLRQLSTELGLDADAIFAQMQSPEVAAVIANNRAVADQLDIRGTPTFVMNDQLIRGYLPLDAMRAAVAELRS